MIKPKDLEAFRKEVQALLTEQLPETDANSVFQDMLFNIVLIKGENFDTLELRLLNTAFKELRYALKVFKPYRHTRKIAVFGSARTKKDNPNYKIAAAFGKKMAKEGWMVITGGASGIMEAAMVGAGVNHSFGLNILLPFEQQANPIIQGNPKLINFKYFFTRKLMFLKESEATALFPGGFGTFDEGFESFTLVQTGKAKPRPLMLIDAPGSTFWKDFIKLIDKQLRKNALISQNDLSLISHHQNINSATAELRSFYKNYDSGRFMRDKYLIRLKKDIKDKQLIELNSKFKDMLYQGAFERVSSELDDDKNPSLYRITFPFDKSSYARLRMLIDHLNRL